jgi:hypothetical protein
MSTEEQRDRVHPAWTTDRALRRIVAEIVDGLRRGYFHLQCKCSVDRCCEPDSDKGDKS